MTPKAPPLPGLPSPRLTEADVAAATEALFIDIANATGNDDLRKTIGMINAYLHTIRPVEVAFIPGRKEEFEALSEAWGHRDMQKLRDLTAAYFRRRRDMVPQLTKATNHPN